MHAVQIELKSFRIFLRVRDFSSCLHISMLQNWFSAKWPCFSKMTLLVNMSLLEQLNTSTQNMSHPHLNALENRPALQYFFVTCLVLQSFFGTLGNLLVIGAVCIVPALRTTGNAFIVNLSLADLLVTCVTQPSSFLGALLGEEYFQTRPTACSVVGTLCAMGCIASTWNICMISVNRFFVICYFELYHRIYTKAKTILMCAGVWLLIYLIEMPNQVGWGDTRFSTVFYMCTFANHVHSYALFYIGVGVCIPVGVSFFAYLAIYLKVRNSSLVRNRILMKREIECESKAAETGVNTTSVPTGREGQPKPRQSLRDFHKNVRVAKALFRVFVIFLVMWLPVAVLILLGWGTAVDPVWYILTVLLAHGNSSINSLVYALSLDHFREGYMRILGFRRNYASVGPDGRPNTNNMPSGSGSRAQRPTLTTEFTAGINTNYSSSSATECQHGRPISPSVCVS